MKWSDLFNLNKKCTHPKVPIEDDIGYCPDCGELVENHWYITRCSCCGVKQRATIRDGEVVPEEGFCHNCGSRAYQVEEIEKRNYRIHSKLDGCYPNIRLHTEIAAIIPTKSARSPTISAYRIFEIPTAPKYTAKP